MAHIHRLICSLFLLFASFAASAAITPVSSTEYGVNLASGTTYGFSTPVSACQAKVAYLASVRSYAQTYAGVSANGALCYVSHQYGTEQHSIFPRAATTCPANSTLSGSICTCNATFTESGGACVSIAAQQKTECDALAQGLNFVGAPMVHHGPVGLTACFGGYVMQGTGGASGGGQSELYGPFSCSGQSASTCTEVPKPPEIVQDCPVGSFPGIVNGLPYCAKPSSTVDAPKTTTATPPAPGASAPAIADAPPFTTTKLEASSCRGDACTITTFYKNEAGETLGSKTETMTPAEYCAQNPGAATCKEKETSWSAADCLTPPACDGDAISCAIAAQTFKTACALSPDANDESALYDSEKLKVDTVIVDDLPGSKTVGINSGMFSTTNVLGGGSGGMADLNVTVAGHSVTLPFTTVNTVLTWLGYILMSVGFLLSSRIVVRG